MGTDPASRSPLQVPIIPETQTPEPRSPEFARGKWVARAQSEFTRFEISLSKKGMDKLKS